MEDLLGALARLNARLESLERRISLLELQIQPAASSLLQAANVHGEMPASEKLSLPQVESVFLVVGKAMLGIAGAYVLRAIAESGLFPQLVVIVLALGYAGMWLVWAARAPVDARFTRTAYAATAALILAPMLGELTLRFQALPAFATAGLLSAFVIVASALAWQGNLGSMVWVTAGTAIVTALTLLMVSHALVPYIAALFVVALASEFASGADRWPSLRFLVSPAVDFAVVILIYIHSLPENSRPDYVGVYTPILLVLPSLAFLIYGASVTYTTTILCRRITIFEIVQSVIVFLIAALSWLWFAPAGGNIVLGVFCWFLSGACYAAAFLRFDTFAEQRNFHVYSSWGIALLVVGSFLLLSATPRALFLSVISVLATLAGIRFVRLTLEFHGLVYLLGAALASGFLTYAARALAGTFPAVPGWMVWIVAATALLCYAIGGRFQGKRWNQKLLRLLSATLAVSAVATFLVSGLVWLAAMGINSGTLHIAVIRTLITCALALALAFAGSRWDRSELVWTAYGTLAFVTVKLVFEDLPHGHSGSIAISIFLYAMALMVISRLTRTASNRDKGSSKNQPGPLTLE